MAKTSQKDVWHTAIKQIGNGWAKIIAKIADIGATTYWVGQGLEIGDDGAVIIFTTASPDHPAAHFQVAEPIVDDDLFCLIKVRAPEILHNQKLASTYEIGDCVYQTAAGTWTWADKDTAASLIGAVGFVVGPVDRITAGVVKGINDAFTATEPVDILLVA